MADNWPASLPAQVLIDGYNDTFKGGLLETSTEVGPGQTRPRSFSSPRPFQGNMILTQAQLLTLKTFFEDTLRIGSLPFNFTDPYDGSAILARLSPKPTVINLSGNKYAVTLYVLVMP